MTLVDPPVRFLRTTALAEQLHNDLDTLSEWPERVKHMQVPQGRVGGARVAAVPDARVPVQRNWIGRSVGARVEFKAIPGGGGGGGGGGASWDAPLQVFTTRIDTLLGVTFVAVAPDHALVRAAAGRDPGGPLGAYLARTGVKYDVSCASC